MLALLDEVLDAVDVPVLAAGGIGSGRAVAAVLAAGADGARVGTRFVAAEESAAHPTYVPGLVNASARDSIYTEAFSGGWPDAPHRVLRSSIEAAEAFQGDIVGTKERLDGELVPWPRLASGVATRASTGTIEAMPMWAGESVSGVTRVEPAAAILDELIGEAERLLQRFGLAGASTATH